MSAFRGVRERVRTVLLSGLSAVAIACAASFAFADPLPPLEPFPERRDADLSSFCF